MKTKIYVEINGGVLQEVYGDNIEYCLIDWDNIREGELPSETFMEAAPLRLAEQSLKEAEESVTKKDVI